MLPTFLCWRERERERGKKNLVSWCAMHCHGVSLGEKINPVNGHVTNKMESDIKEDNYSAKMQHL